MRPSLRLTHDTSLEEPVGEKPQFAVEDVVAGRQWDGVRAGEQRLAEQTMSTRVLAIESAGTAIADRTWLGCQLLEMTDAERQGIRDALDGFKNLAL
ncbi:hypothetical protein [Bythopirellula goksoeyrii]|uniref:Uncharacterized protein n=1 Tax=Bythopirellula goksoeyrii TaxID=1400387 RepID=A0A5B9QHD6_9BACT|nr:hypothetical protein [Bythopirellula goksoeyrii]QEG37349.1 hypothetical protein Pr1d_46900 [Bythopirellula goksoeyrii]